MSDINFDQLKQEIRVAENYLRTDLTSTSSSDGFLSTRMRNPEGSFSLDIDKKESILQRFGRRSLASSQEVSQRVSSKSDAEAVAGKQTLSYDRISVAKDPYWKEGGRPHDGIMTEKLSDGNVSSARYSEPSEREKLISRLLADHETKFTSDSSVTTSKKQVTPAYYDYFEDNVATSELFFERNEASNPNDSPRSPTSSGGDDAGTLFFASDLSLPPSSGFLSGYPDDELTGVLSSQGLSGPVSAIGQRGYAPQEQGNKNRSTRAIDYYGGDDSDQDCGINVPITHLASDVSRGYGRYDAPIDIDTYTDTEMTHPHVLLSSGALKAASSVYQNKSDSASAEFHRTLKQLETGTCHSDGDGDAGTLYRDPVPSNIALKVHPREDREGHEHESLQLMRSAPASISNIHTASADLTSVSLPLPLPLSAPQDPSSSSASNMHKRFHKSREELAAQAEASFQEQCAFRPTICPTSSSSTENRRDSRGAARIEEMQMLYKRSREERAKQKKEHLQAELSNCTFQPQISHRSSSSSVSSSSSRKAGAASIKFNAVNYLCGGSGYLSKGSNRAVVQGGPEAASLRLHDEAEQRAAQQRWLEKQIDEARLVQFTFQPAINPVSTTLHEDINRRPIHERVGELQRGKEDRLRCLKQTHEDSLVDLTFTPQIDPKSRKIAVKKLEADGFHGQQDESCPAAPPSDVCDRLHREGEAAMRRKEKLCSEREQALALEMEPARPCKGTEKLALNSDRVGASFEDRQAMHSKRVTSTSLTLKQAADMEGASWFKPKIGKSADIIAEKRPELVHETPESRATRMSRLTAEEMQMRRKVREEELYGGMTFVPDIDPLSRAIGRTRGLQELVENKGGCRARQAAKLAAEKLAASQCTFKPAINDYPSSSNRSFERCMERECGGETEEQRYNADLTPVGWAECPLVTHKKSLSSSSSSIRRGERGGEVDVADVTSSGEDSLDPLRSRCAEESKGPRSKHSHGTHGRSGRCTVNLNEPERMSRNIRERQEAKEKRRRDELIARDIEEMKECTFQPALTPHTNTSSSSSRHNNSHSHSDMHALYGMSPQEHHQQQQQQQQPVIVRGLGRHLELKHLSLRQREEASRRERAVFSVTNIDNFRRQEDGSTIIKPFTFSEMSSRCSRNASFSTPNISREKNKNTSTDTFMDSSSRSRNRLGATVMQR